jgi:DNA-binding IclR family transcriptional regulator
LNHNKDPKKVVLETLRKHPEGLTILELAKFTEMNRLTVAKYVCVLIAEKLISERRIGSAKLCYLKRMKK